MKRILNRNIVYRVLSVLFLGMIFMTLTSCEKEVKNSKKRNILFYIGGDCDLSGEAATKIDQIRAGWTPGKGEMLIYADRQNQGAALLRINNTKDANGYYGLDTLEVYGNENSADAAVLNRVINKVVSHYPADCYGMIFFSHASGWLPEGTLSNPRSMVIDSGDNGEGANREMEYTDFAAAIPDGQFDFIILEACLMADVMSMYELRHKAQYILASSAEIVSPGFGGRNNILTETYKNEVMRLYDVQNPVNIVVSGFGQAYYDRIAAIPENSAYCSTTLSVIKMDEMENLALMVKSVLQGVEFNEANLNINEIQNFDRATYTRRMRYLDLGHVMENLVSDSQYEIFNNQLEKTVVWKVATKGFLLGERYNYYINHHSGLTTYITQSKYPFLNSVYEESAWYKAIQ